MKELVAAGNALTQLMVAALAPTLPGANIGYFDSHGFFSDMYHNPAKVCMLRSPRWRRALMAETVSERHGAAERDGRGRRVPVRGERDEHGGLHVRVAYGAAKDSFLWADELHPSEQADRRLAQTLFSILGGKTREWIKFYRG
jgi:hypothetical protein